MRGADEHDEEEDVDGWTQRQRDALQVGPWAFRVASALQYGLLDENLALRSTTQVLS